MSKELIERARIKAGVMEMGERIQWGSDTAIMRELADALEEAERRIAELKAREKILVSANSLANIERNEAERKLAIAREALNSCGVNHGLNGPQQYYDESLVDAALAQIGEKQ